MKILYDHQIFEHQRIGGVSRYFAEIIDHLPDGIEADVSVKFSFNEYLKNLNIPFVWKDQLVNYVYFLPNLNFKGKKKLYQYLEKNYPHRYPDYFKLNQEETIKKLKKQEFDLFHPTFYDDYFLDYMGNKPYVLTVHDMIIELYPEFINSPQFISRKKRLVEKASHIIAVSENTKYDIIKVFGTSPDKISVVHHASSLNESENKLPDLPEKYILYVGDRRLGYKNFAFFIYSVAPILIDNKDINIVCTGSEFTPEEIYFFKSLNIVDRLQVRFVNDGDMYALYKSALMFIYPSYYEGFGIPILEAFQAGCPVVLTDSSCFPEVAGDAGIYFNAKSPQGMREVVLSLINSGEYRNRVIKNGKKRLESFSWEKSAEKTVEIYKKVLGK